MQKKKNISLTWCIKKGLHMIFNQMCLYETDLSCRKKSDF